MLVKKTFSATFTPFFLLFWVFSSFLAPLTIYANTTSTVITKVGNPSTPPPGNGTLLKVANDLYSAYTAPGCPSTARVSTQLSECLTRSLLADGYDKSLVDQVASYNNLTSNFEAASGTVECIQFVRQIIILAYGGYDPRIGPGANGNTAYSFASINNNGHILNKVNGQPQPGDIAVNPGNTSDDSGTVGHIAIVTDVGGLYFTAIESNYNPPYTVTKDNHHHPIENYVYFREQP